MHSVIEVVAVVGIVVHVLVRQVLGELQRVKRVLLLPAVLTLVGALDLTKDGRHCHPLDIVLIAASGVLAVLIGVAQGAVMRLERRDGGLWATMPARGLWLWAGLIGSRLVIGAIAASGDAHVAASTASILLVLGVNRLAQGGVVAGRAARAGIPFAAAPSAAAGPRPVVVTGVRSTPGTSVVRAISDALDDVRGHRGRDGQGRGSRRGRDRRRSRR